MLKDTVKVLTWVFSKLGASEALKSGDVTLV